MTKICGVVCEYDPFHSGHKHHLLEARRQSGADAVVCIMSGPITQRGQFARYDKYIRAASALKNGADLVLELPVRYSCGAADEFASGAMAILANLSGFTHLSFGCEPALIPHLPKIADIYRREPAELTQKIQTALATGLSYPAAHAEATADYLGDPELKRSLLSPNAILALQYLKALPEGIHPVPIERIGAFHSDSSETAPFVSAETLRHCAIAGSLPDLSDYLPDAAPYLLAEACHNVHEPNGLSEALLYRLRTMTPDDLRDIHGIREGLEYRFLKAAETATDRDSLIAMVKTRRYTHARLSRICTAILLGLTKEMAAMAVPAYARVLGIRSPSLYLLSDTKKSDGIPLVTRFSQLPADSPQFRLDHAAQSLWSLGCTNPDQRTSGLDLRTPMLKIDE